MAITVIFVITYIPKVTLMIVESQNANFWLTMSAEEFTGYRFLYTFYIINNIVNPFIYGFFDVKFREELKIFFCKMNN